MSYEQKLMAMKGLLKKSTDKKEPTRKITVPSSPPYEAQWLAAGLMKEENQYGVVYKKVVKYGRDYTHGDIELAGLQSAIAEWQNSGEVHPLAPDASKRIVFFDTETTGLKGAGTLIFLLGFIEQIGESFQLTQYVLPGPDHEAAFLYASRLWEEVVTLVTYNGKSFDVPQLETRWTLNRHTVPPLLTHNHIDLLHGSRRVWKEEIATFKLTHIEEEKLGFFRDGDIPGHLAPIIYQDAVKSGHASTLMKVLKHNEWDILSLVSLYIRSTKLILENETPETAISQTNIGKWFSDLKSFKRSGQIFEMAIEKYGEDHPVTHFHFGFILKRNLAYDEAIHSFAIAAKRLSGRMQIIALEELAKLYEHKLKDLKLALKHTVRGQSLLKTNQEITMQFRKREENNFLKREMRLRRKLFPGEAQKKTGNDF